MAHSPSILALAALCLVPGCYQGLLAEGGDESSAGSTAWQAAGSRICCSGPPKPRWRDCCADAARNAAADRSTTSLPIRRRAKLMPVSDTIRSSASRLSPASASSCRGPRRILIIDDDNDFVASTKALLEANGVTVEIEGRHVGVGAFASERILVTA